MYSVLIVDDEQLARMRVWQLLASADDFVIAGECSDAASAMSAVQKLSPDLMFLDIHMPGIDGINVAEGLRDTGTRVIFLTAHPEHAVRAFDIDAVDYLVKPVSQARFTEALGKASRALENRVMARLLVSTGRGDIVIDTGEIDWLGADGAYVYVYHGGRRHLLRESLTSLTQRLGQQRFVNVHRSAAVNVDRVKETRRGEGNDLELILADGTRVPVSRRRAAAVLKRLGRRAE
jgi:two-component system LytT family response regulator